MVPFQLLLLQCHRLVHVVLSLACGEKVTQCESTLCSKDSLILVCESDRCRRVGMPCAEAPLLIGFHARTPVFPDISVGNGQLFHNFDDLFIYHMRHVNGIMSKNHGEINPMRSPVVLAGNLIYRVLLSCCLGPLTLWKIHLRTFGSI